MEDEVEERPAGEAELQRVAAEEKQSLQWAAGEQTLPAAEPGNARYVSSSDDDDDDECWWAGPWLWAPAPWPIS